MNSVYILNFINVATIQNLEVTNDKELVAIHRNKSLTCVT